MNFMHNLGSRIFSFYLFYLFYLCKISANRSFVNANLFSDFFFCGGAGQKAEEIVPVYLFNYLFVNSCRQMVFPEILSVFYKASYFTRGCKPCVFPGHFSVGEDD